jgi:phosphatidylinositol glycan class M
MFFPTLQAARYVAQGESPFRRGTYRYTPFLAWLLVPNIWCHFAFGKVLFAFLDLITAALMERILRLRVARIPMPSDPVIVRISSLVV